MTKTRRPRRIVREALWVVRDQSLFFSAINIKQSQDHKGMQGGSKWRPLDKAMQMTKTTAEQFAALLGAIPVSMADATRFEKRVRPAPRKAKA